MKYSFKKSSMLLLVFLTLVVNAVGVTSAYAATLTVTTVNDSGAGSLRQAIADATAGDTITFGESLAGQTIHLASTLIIDKDLTIDGSSLTAQIIISGDTDNNGTGDVRVFMVNAGVTAVLKNLTITKGNGDALIPGYGANGGGIFNEGILTVTNSTISESTVANDDPIEDLESGGAIANVGTATVTNSTFLNNRSTFIGGALYNHTGAEMSVVNSTFSANVAVEPSGGGAIFNDGTLTLINNTLSGNTTGIRNWPDGTLHLSNNIIANSAAGGDCINTGTTGPGTISTNINNLVGDGSCSPLLSGAPGLDLLEDNGGPAQTFALLPGSLALGAGDNATCSAAPVNGLDQRGRPRPEGDPSCDIGAFESSAGPAAPVVTSPASLTNDSTPTISGTAEPYSQVNVSFDDSGSPVQICANVAVNGFGNWSCVSSATLPEGLTPLTVNATDRVGNVSPDTLHSFTVDLTAPAAPVVAAPTGTINDTTPTISGTAEASSVVNVSYLDDSNNPVTICANVAVDGAGNWSCTSSVTLPGRTIQLKVTATDTAGNVSPEASHSFTVELSSPTVSSIVRANANHTSAASVNFTVTFSKPVLNVDANDFTLQVTGNITGASIGSVSGSGSTRTVTVNTGSGNGTLGLRVPVGATITDLVGNPIAGLPFTSGQSYIILKEATFSDVATDYWAWQHVERLYNAGITGGCNVNPLQYCPEGTVTRAQMAVFLLRGIHGSSYTPPAVGASTGFGDVATGHWAAAWIKQLAAEGITAGCGNGNYCPESAVTRAQMAVFLLRSKHGASYTPPAVGASTGFGDVDPTYWAAAWIKQLVAESITAGCGSGNYCPNSSVTRAQMAVFLVKTFNLP